MRIRKWTCFKQKDRFRKTYYRIPVAAWRMGIQPFFKIRRNSSTPSFQESCQVELFLGNTLWERLGTKWCGYLIYKSRQSQGLEYHELLNLGWNLKCVWEKLDILGKMQALLELEFEEVMHLKLGFKLMWVTPSWTLFCHFFLYLKINVFVG